MPPTWQRGNNIDDIMFHLSSQADALHAVAVTPPGTESAQSPLSLTSQRDAFPATLFPAIYQCGESPSTIRVSAQWNLRLHSCIMPTLAAPRQTSLSLPERRYLRIQPYDPTTTKLFTPSCSRHDNSNFEVKNRVYVQRKQVSKSLCQWQEQMYFIRHFCVI